MSSTNQSQYRAIHLLRQAFAATMLASLFASTSLWADTIRVPQDHKTIQAGIDAAKAGDTVVVSAGIYKERIRLKSGITDKSAGDDAKGALGLNRAETTTIDGNIEGATSPGVVMAENSTLDGFSVTGVGKYDDDRWNKHHATQGEEQAKEPIGAPGTAGIAVTGVTRCTVTNNIVHHIGYTGIGITGAKGKHVSPHIFRNVTYRNMGGGIGSMRGSSAIVEENICFENFYAGIGHENANPLVINNTCYKNVRAGIGISEGACPTVRGNKCYHNRRAGIGIRTESTTSPVVEHNECYENDMAGIGSRDDATPIIRHNRCYKNKMAGIGCRTKARPLIEHNECFENKMAGIGCRTEAEPVIRHNRCYDNEMAGIGSQLAARPVILGNDCFGNLMAGIGTETEAVAVIRDNKCYKNLMAGIGSRTGALPVIEGNHCYENLLAGIGSQDNSVPIIRNNQCEKNGQAGIGTQTGARAVIVENECRNNSTSGIGVREKASAIILSNKCIENKLVAIGIRNGSDAYIGKNQLVRTGGMPPMIAVRENSSVVVTDNTIVGGGVAGVMVQGTATILGNRFKGNGPRAGGPPNFAAWIHGGSNVLFSNNRTDRWRHALFASGANQVWATDNTASNFLGTGIVVDKSKLPAHVFGNIALSESEKDEAVRVKGPQGVVRENVRKTPDPPKESENARTSGNR
jgi:parallel beta-helix repeat protein